MQRHIGTVLLLVILGLSSLGLVMLYSTSAPVLTDKAEREEAKQAAAPKTQVRKAPPKAYDFLKKQSIWLGIGMAAALALVWLDYHWLTKHAWVWLGIALGLCVLVFVPHIGIKAKGASRWIGLGGFTLQPSELAKVAVVIFLAHWYRDAKRLSEDWLEAYAKPVAVVGLFLLIFVRQHDLGYTFHLGLVFWCILVCAGAKWRFTLPIPFLGVGGILVMALAMPERRSRLLAFMDPEKYALDKFWQQGQALIAFGSGGLQGLGLGNSRQKMFYVPEAHNDFIFPIVGEELGLMVTLAVVLMYLLLMLCGGWISLHAPDREGHLLGMGLTVLISAQALMNLLVVTALAPNKGVPLPFISYGGSNLLMMLASAGILFNLHRQCDYGAQPRPRPIPSRVSLRM